MAEFTVEYDNNNVILGSAFTDSSMGKGVKAIVLDKKTNDPKMKNQVIGHIGENKKDSNWYVHFPFELGGRDSEPIVVHYKFTINGQEFFGRRELSVAPVPDEFALYQNYPNPFNPITTIEYALPEKDRVNIAVYDINGRFIKSLVDEIQEPGYRSVKWNSTNSLGEQVSTGVYFYMISSGKNQIVRKMLLMK